MAMSCVVIKFPRKLGPISPLHGADAEAHAAFHLTDIFCAAAFVCVLCLPQLCFGVPYACECLMVLFVGKVMLLTLLVGVL